MSKKRKKHEYSLVYFLISFCIVVLATYLLATNKLVRLTGSSAHTDSSSKIAAETATLTTAIDQVSTDGQAQEVLPAAEVRAAELLWEGGRYTDVLVGISLEVPAGWRIIAAYDPALPILELFPPTPNTAVAENMIERIQIYKLDTILETTQLEADASFTILSHQKILVAKKYRATRTDTYATQDGLKWYNTFIVIENKKIGMDFLDIGFFERPETQTVLNSLELLE
jgi:hypothetical protein